MQSCIEIGGKKCCLSVVFSGSPEEFVIWLRIPMQWILVSFQYDFVLLLQRSILPGINILPLMPKIKWRRNCSLPCSWSLVAYKGRESVLSFFLSIYKIETQFLPLWCRYMQRTVKSSSVNVEYLCLSLPLCLCKKKNDLVQVWNKVHCNKPIVPVSV